jgi:hypothetical protein
MEMVAASRIDRKNTRCMIDPWIWKLRIFVSMKFPNLELLEQKGLLNLSKREEIFEEIIERLFEKLKSQREKREKNLASTKP